MKFLRMSNLPLQGKRVLMRVDFNVPLNEERDITDDTRIRATLPGIQAALKAGAKLMLASHLGRPTEGEWNAHESLAPIATRLSSLLGVNVPLIRDWVDGSFQSSLADGKVVLLENCRFNKGEKKNDDALAQKVAALCDVFVMDAFGTAHRAEVTTHGVAKYAPVAAAGPLLAAELDALGKALEEPKRPLVAVVGGSKVSTKLDVLKTLATTCDQLIVGGGIANTFLLAEGHKIGKSLAEPEMVGAAKEILAIVRSHGGDIPVPVDVVCAKQFSADAKAVLKTVGQVTDDDMIFDIGPRSSARLADIIANAGTIVWNGPLGVFEFDQFGLGTQSLALEIASSPAFSIAGGGDTLAAVAKYRITDRVGYISTGGGAFLEFLEGKKLPAVAILEERAKK